MQNKRSRTSRSCSHLETEATGANVAPRSAEQSSSSATGARNKSPRTSMSVDQVANQPIPPPSQLREVIFTIEPPPPLPDQRPPPLPIQVTGGSGVSLHTNPMLPPASLDSCNYCKKRIGPQEDRYMSGCRGLEAYCCPACREKFNNMMIAAGKRSPDKAESSMEHLQWNKRQ